MRPAVASSFETRRKGAPQDEVRGRPRINDYDAASVARGEKSFLYHRVGFRGGRALGRYGEHVEIDGDLAAFVELQIDRLLGALLERELGVDQRDVIAAGRQRHLVAGRNWQTAVD